MELTRIIIYPKDVQRITGKSERYGRKLINRIKLKNAKEKHHFVSIEEFSEYTGLSVELIKKYIQE